MTLSDLLDLSPASLREAYDEASETLTWLALCTPRTVHGRTQRDVEFNATLALCDRIRFAMEIREAVAPQGRPVR